MSCSEAGREVSSNEVINSFLILRSSCTKRLTASACSGWLSAKSSAQSTEDQRNRRMSTKDGLSSSDFITPSSRTIPRHSIPFLLCFRRAIKRYSVLWRNLTVVSTVHTVQADAFSMIVVQDFD